MNWAAIWSAIHGLLSGLGNKDKWKMSINGEKNEPITEVTVKANGIKFGFKVGEKDMILEAVQGNLDHATVKVNGKEDKDARLIFSLRHQFRKPLIVVFEFKNVTVDGETKRYRFDNPK